MLLLKLNEHSAIEQVRHAKGLYDGNKNYLTIYAAKQVIVSV